MMHTSKLRTEVRHSPARFWSLSSTHKTPNPCTTASTQSVYKHPACNFMRTAKELIAIERTAAQGLCSKMNTEALGVHPAGDVMVPCNTHRPSQRLDCVSSPRVAGPYYSSCASFVRCSVIGTCGTHCHHCSHATSRHALACWLVTTTRQCCTAQSSFNRRVPQISLLWTSYCGSSSRHIPSSVK